MSGFNPTLTIQALAYMSADAIANRYQKSPGPLLVVVRQPSELGLSPSSRHLGRAQSRAVRLAQAKPKPQWGIGSHGNRKDRCRHRRRGRGRRNSRGRARQSGHESHRARARSASHDRRTSTRTTSCATSSGRICARTPKRQPVTWRPNANARATPIPAQKLRQPGRRRHRALRRGVVAPARGRFPRALADDRALRRVGYPAGLLARRLAVELRRPRALLRPRRIRARRFGQGRQSAGKQDRRRQRVRSAAPSRISAAAVAAWIKPASSSMPAPRSSAITRFRRRAQSCRQPYNGRPGCTYCGFCQAFGCHVGAKSSILVTKLPEADATGNFKLITGAMCYRVNSDNSGRATGVAYYGPDGSDNTIEAEIVILIDLHLRQHPPAAAVEDGQSSRTASPTRAATWASTSWPT